MIEELRTFYDPEIPVDIYELGLIYEVDVDEAARSYDPHDAHLADVPGGRDAAARGGGKARGVAGVSDVKLDLVWDPPWNPSMMSEAARLELGM